MAEHHYDTEMRAAAYGRRKRAYMLRKGYEPPAMDEAPIDRQQALWQFVLWAIVVPAVAALCTGLAYAVSLGLEAFVVRFT